MVDVRPDGSILRVIPVTTDPDCERGRVVDEAILGRPLVPFRELLVGVPEARFLRITSEYGPHDSGSIHNHTSS